jgi:hypothetical protein
MKNDKDSGARTQGYSRISMRLLRNRSDGVELSNAGRVPAIARNFNRLGATPCTAR